MKFTFLCFHKHVLEWSFKDTFNKTDLFFQGLEIGQDIVYICNDEFSTHLSVLGTQFYKGLEDEGCIDQSIRHDQVFIVAGSAAKECFLLINLPNVDEIV